MVQGQIQISYQLVNSKSLDLRELNQDAVLEFLGRYSFCFFPIIEFFFFVCQGESCKNY